MRYKTIKYLFVFIFLSSCYSLVKEKKNVDSKRTSKPSISYDAWKNTGQPLLQLANYNDKFYTTEKGIFSLEEIDTTILFALSEKDYLNFYQRYTEAPSTFAGPSEHKKYEKTYLYSKEKQIFLPSDSSTCIEVFLPISKIDKNKSGYIFNFLTVLEISENPTSIQILPLFYLAEEYGFKNATAEKSNIGIITCCHNPYPLAEYSKTKDKETISYSKILEGRTIQKTEIIRKISNGKIIETDSTIWIMHLGITDIVDFGDSKQYLNGKLIHDFSDEELRKKLGY